ncbi:MAG TPA: EAL domain-containing protein [Steroidobacteraceae bacterium]|nr:EAL domain-containing protein [Steroidobacteraceae bacterium]
MQSLNAIAVRSPTNTPPAAESAPSEPPTPESLGWQLRAALPPLRLHSVSLYDDQANVLWLSEGALGPDEHGAVMGALEDLTSDTTKASYQNSLEDGRMGLFIPVRAPQGALVGLAMILADIKSVGDGVVDRLVTPQVRTIVQKLAVLMRPPPSRAARADTTSEPVAIPADIVPPTLSAAPESVTAAAELSPEAVDDILEFELAPESPAAAASPATQRAPLPANVLELTLAATSDIPAPAAPAPVSVTAKPAPGPQPVKPQAAPPTSAAAAPASTGATTRSNVLTASSTSNPRVMAAPTATSTSKALPAMSAGTGTSPAVASSASTTTKALAAGLTGTPRVLTLPDGVTLTLELQPYNKLRPGGRTRRFEVLASATVRETQKITSGLDSFALQRLLSWMGANRGAWSSEPTSFTLNLSIATLEDDRFPQFVASNLKTHGIGAENLGFEIAEALCVQRRAQVERFITLCDKLGCFVVIDDFSFDATVVPLLRSKALRLVKIDPKLTAVALRDKLAQAMVVAIAQASKVLGIHCAAKGVESQAAIQWLAAVGCDFGQGPGLSPRQTLESLAAPSAGRA